VSLGIYNLDENTTGEMIKILKKFQKYVPVVNGLKLEVVGFGDGLSSDR